MRSDCMATIGQVGNIDHQNIKLGKAGRKRLMGWRPTVRGSAMTPRDIRMVAAKADHRLVCQVPRLLGKAGSGFIRPQSQASDKMIVSVEVNK